MTLSKVLCEKNCIFDRIEFPDNVLLLSMTKIGLLSDTHGDLPHQIFDYFKDVDEIWHAGDIGDLKVTDQLKAFKPLRAVFGNIDNNECRAEFPEHLHFEVEGVRCYLTHIGGRPGNWSKSAYLQIQKHQPQLFICGHSHILLVKHDKQNNMLCINPGACGNKGFHTIKTLLRFEIHEGKIQQMEVIELGKRNQPKQFTA